VHLYDETTSGHALPAKKAASLLVVGAMFGEAVRWKAIHLALMTPSWLLSVLRGVVFHGESFSSPAWCGDARESNAGNHQRRSFLKRITQGASTEVFASLFAEHWFACS